MLKTELLDRRIRFSFTQREHDCPPFLEEPLVVEINPHANSATQALSAGNAGDGDEGSLKAADGLLQNLERDPLRLHPGGT